jgi:hypothetical protein
MTAILNGTIVLASKRGYVFVADDVSGMPTEPPRTRPPLSIEFKWTMTLGAARSAVRNSYLKRPVVTDSLRHNQDIRAYIEAR